MITSPIVLCILDGFGITRNTRGNAIRDAYTPTLDHIAAFHPSLALQASGFSVGMLWGEAGNSMTGHTTIGAGRIVYNHLPRILREIRNGNFFKNPVLQGAITHTRQNRSTLHLVGLISGASTHSYLDHLYALLELAKQTDTPASLHILTDGRDSAPRQAERVLEALQTRITKNAYPVRFATLMGRYWAMDRTEAWDRILRAYLALTSAEDVHSHGDLLEHLREEYARGVTDEFITPAACEQSSPGKNNRIRDHDAVIFFNFREDSMRELVSAFAQPGFSAFERVELKNLYIATFTRYGKDLPVGVAFPMPEIVNPLSEVLSNFGIKQLKVAESQKLAHVTYFFNAGREEPYKFEDRSIFPSDTRPVGENPAMRADAICDEIVRTVERTAHEFILANIPNADAAAHTGDYRTTLRAIEAMDGALGRVYKCIVHRGGALLITSDHGSAEDMFNIRTGEIRTGHSDNPVPFFFVTSRNRFRAARTEEETQHRNAQPLGVLADIAPTVLALLGVRAPQEMTGRNLLDLL